MLSLPSPPLGLLLVPQGRGQGTSRVGAQALISTGPASSCSRIRCTPAVRSEREALRELPGELEARGGDVCVRLVVGERTGERG